MAVGNHKEHPVVAMAVTNDLLTDRRVLRHADTLREAGYEVLLIGRNDLKVRSKRSWRFYAEYNIRLFWRLLHTRCDVVWANDTDTLPACWLAARLRNRYLVMDSHEIFPQVPELQERPRVRHVWEWIERTLMPRCDANLTVCQSVADYYHSLLGIKMEVVRNLPATPTPLTPHSSSTQKTLLYQGAVNLGRGVDWAIDALQWLDDCQLVVAGTGDLIDEMRAYAAQKPWSDRVSFLGRLHPEELEQLTPQADVGLVMLEDMGLNYRFALPNRIGDFVAAGVPIVVSDLPEMAAVVRRFGVGEVMTAPGAEALAHAVKKILSRQWSEADFTAARADMDWEKEKQKLLKIIEN